MSISSAPAACPSCMFGATSTSILSFTYHAIETITVSVIPHVTVYTNGTEKTSFQSITETNTEIVGSGTNSTVPRTFTNTNDITWTVGDATLTYPTTYVHYLGFEGAPATTDNVESCAELSDATSVELPSSTNLASFIYPLAANATTGMQLPTPLLDYLAQLPEVSSQFSGDPLTGCGPLTWNPPAFTSAETTASTSSSSSAASYPSFPAYSAPGQSSSRSGNYSYLTTKIRPTASLPPSSHSKTPSQVTLSTALSPTLSPTQPGHPHPQTPGPPIGSGSYAVPPTISSSAPVGYTATTSPQGTLTHTTAFVIEPITGPTTYTTISGPKADHSKWSLLSLQPYMY